jgi:hypothetical protein
VRGCCSLLLFSFPSIAEKSKSRVLSVLRGAVDGYEYRLFIYLSICLPASDELVPSVRTKRFATSLYSHRLRARPGHATPRHLEHLRFVRSRSRGRCSKTKRQLELAWHLLPVLCAL